MCTGSTAGAAGATPGGAPASIPALTADKAGADAFAQGEGNERLGRGLAFGAKTAGEMIKASAATPAVSGRASFGGGAVASGAVQPIETDYKGALEQLFAKRRARLMQQ